MSWSVVALLALVALRKVAVIFEFDHVLICRTCSSPSDDTQPRGNVIRISFDRATHAQKAAIRFCSVRKDCLHR